MSSSWPAPPEMQAMKNLVASPDGGRTAAEASLGLPSLPPGRENQPKAGDISTASAEAHLFPSHHVTPQCAGGSWAAVE